MNFKNLRDVEKHFNKMREKELEKIIESEAIKLKDFIQKEILNYYKSYQPSVYIRTYKFAKSIRVEKAKRAGDEIYVRIYFDQSLANHASLVRGSKGETGFVPNLINTGWQWHNGQDTPYRFARYGGSDFINNAVKKYMATNKKGFNIQVEGVYNGQTFYSKWY